VQATFSTCAAIPGGLLPPVSKIARQCSMRASNRLHPTVMVFRMSKRANGRALNKKSPVVVLVNRKVQPVPANLSGACRTQARRAGWPENLRQGPGSVGAGGSRTAPHDGDRNRQILHPSGATSIKHGISPDVSGEDERRRDLKISNFEDNRHPQRQSYRAAETLLGQNSSEPSGPSSSLSL